MEFDSAKGYFIRFIMPDHNVRLECVTENTMTDTIAVPDTEPEVIPEVDETPVTEEPVTEPEVIPEPEPEEIPTVPTESAEPTRFLTLIKSYNHHKK